MKLSAEQAITLVVSFGMFLHTLKWLIVEREQFFSLLLFNDIGDIWEGLGAIVGWLFVLGSTRFLIFILEILS